MRQGFLRRTVPVYLLFVGTVIAIVAGFTLRALIGFVVVAVATVVVARAVVKRVTVPMQVIRDGAHRYSAGELTFRVAVDEPVEARELAESLNSMALQLHGRMTTVTDQRNEVEAILGAMVEGVVVLDETKLIRRVNDTAARLFDREPREAVGRTVIEFFRSSELDDLAGAALSGDVPVERMITVYGRTIRYLVGRGNRFPRAKGGSGVLLVLSDVTELKRLETLRRDFVANVSHELRTPITIIKGYVETLLDADDGGEPDPATTERFLTVILTQTNRINAIIEDLLSLARLEQSGRAIRLAPCRIDEAVNAVRLACGAKAEARGMTIRDRYSGDPKVSANIQLLEQALINLVDNAVKYADDNSTIDIGVTNRGGRLRIDVTDTGPGIPERDLPRIFERFYRLDRARARDLGGTGLGLSIVKHIALAHGGDVGVVSRVGKGSTFSIDIPSTLPGTNGST